MAIDWGECMGLPSSLEGDEWSATTARQMFPLLVWCAKHGVRITYGQLDRELQRRSLGHHVTVVVYGHPAGAIGDTCLELEAKLGEKIPPLNAIVVNKDTGIPGTGCDYYLATYLNKSPQSRITDAQRLSMAEETMEEVWRFQKWDEVLQLCGLNPTLENIPGLSIETVRQAPRRSGWSTEGESKEHQSLKEWVAKNPRVLESRIPFGPGTTEWMFASADRADVMFEHEEGAMAVEVKSTRSNSADLERGIYQCVKYRALLRAELRVSGKIPNGSALLVTEVQLSADLQELADLLDVRAILVPSGEWSR